MLVRGVVFLVRGGTFPWAEEFPLELQESNPPLYGQSANQEPPSLISREIGVVIIIIIIIIIIIVIIIISSSSSSSSSYYYYHAYYYCYYYYYYYYVYSPCS